MNYEVPNAYNWFAKLDLTRFIPWHFEQELDQKDIINKRFSVECEQNRKVLTFGQRQDRKTYVGFEMIEGKITEHVVVFQLSFEKYVKGQTTIESEHDDFFDFMQERVLPEMKEWIPDDDIDDYTYPHKIW